MAKIGLCFGAFDPLHIGHVFLFQRAKKQCDLLIAAIATDNRIRTVKKYEPCFPYCKREMAIAELMCISYIVPYEDRRSVVARCSPDVIFVGNDWQGSEEYGEGLGVEVVFLPRTENVSGTGLRCRL